MILILNMLGCLQFNFKLPTKDERNYIPQILYTNIY